MNVTAINWRHKARWDRIPEHMREGLANYVERGYRPGDFLRCVISNDLRGAVAHADDINRHLLYDYVIFFHAYAPSQCWGSPQAMENWIAAKGLDGLQQQEKRDGDCEAVE